MTSVYLGFGSNIGDRFKNLNDAQLMVEEGFGNIEAESGIYKTEPWGFISEDYFLNMAVRITTGAAPRDILKRIISIEKSLGRLREGKGYSSRTIDIDILFIEDLILNYPDLVVPHPLIHKRMFVLRPLMDIAPGLIHPLLKRSISELINDCTDNLKVTKIK